ncbi:unnamed protein product [Amoebophrya sp. A120]|nr:unnamed protein product [Amoebophrya sp. A120]|eukprot:GSA120T00012523001.1
MRFPGSATSNSSSSFTSFYVDCVQSMQCGDTKSPNPLTTLKNSLLTPTSSCPCKKAVEEFGDRKLVSSNSPVFSTGEQKCDPLSYYYDVQRDTWYKCCGRPLDPGKEKLPLIGDAFTEMIDKPSLLFPTGVKSFLKKVKSAVVDNATALFGAGGFMGTQGKKQQYCVEMKRSKGPDVLESNTPLMDANDVRNGNAFEVPRYNNQLICMTPKFSKLLHQERGDCMCWNSREECIRIGKYGKRTPGMGHRYNVFFV